MQKNIDAEIQHSGSEKKLQTLEEVETSESLPKSVCLQLLDLMKRVVKDEVNPDTVKAACHCAREIHNMIKLNIELKK